VAFSEAGYELVANAIQEGVKTLCAAVPGIEIAPLGAGVEAKPDNICDQVGMGDGQRVKPNKMGEKM
jgi:hypothetical protein